MQIVNLVSGDDLSPKERESDVGEDASLRRSPRPVLAAHEAEVSRRAAKRDTIASVVGTHADKRARPRDKSLKVVDVGRLPVWTRRLVVAAVLI